MMPNPLAFTAGTSTASVGHAIKVFKAQLIQASATAATALVTDINGNVILPLMSIPATVAAQAVLDYDCPVILPGGSLAQPATGAATNFIVTVVGAGATLYLSHR
jgi:hypothetical protein